MSFKYFFEPPYDDRAKWDSNNTQLFLAATKELWQSDMNTTWDTGVMAPRFYISVFPQGIRPGGSLLNLPPQFKVTGTGPLTLSITPHTSASGSFYDTTVFAVAVYSYNW